jgi:hypothetical protein
VLFSVGKANDQALISPISIKKGTSHHPSVCSNGPAPAPTHTDLAIFISQVAHLLNVDVGIYCYFSNDGIIAILVCFSDASVSLVHTIIPAHYR